MLSSPAEVIFMQFTPPGNQQGHERMSDVSSENQSQEYQSLPLLPGMTDAENQPIRIDLPEEAIARLRNWK